MNRYKSATDIRTLIALLPGNLLSITIFKWTFPLSIFLAVFATPEHLGSIEEALIWSGIGALAHLAMLPFFIYGRLKPFGEQFLLVLLMGFVRGGVISILAPLFGVVDSLPALERIANSLIAVLYWVYAGAIIVEYGVDFRKKLKILLNEVLEKNIGGIPEAAKQSQNKVVEVVGHLQERIIATVGSNPSKEEIKRASKDIDNLDNQFIRPLSHSQWKNGELVWLRAGFFAVLKRTLTLNPIPVVAVIVLTSPFTLIAQISRIGFAQTIQVQIIWTSLALLCTKLSFRGAPKGNNYMGQNMKFLSLIFVAYAITFLIQIYSPLAVTQTIGEMVFGYALSAIAQISAYLIGSLLLVLHRDQEFVFEFISDAIKAGELEKLLTMTKTGNLDADYAQYLHAEVQSKLLACKLLLLKAAESDFELFPPEVTKQIVERMEAIKQPYEKPAARIPAKRLESLRKSWAGMADISYESTPAMTELHWYSDVASQLLEEAVVNSIRHGNAKKIAITSQPIDNGIALEVRDDGMFSEGSSGSGLGTILFNTFAKDWQLSREGGMTVLRFEVTDEVDK